MPAYKFGDQENKTFEVVEDGDYILEVIACEFGVTKSKGDEKMELQLQVEGRDAKFYETLTFTEKAAWKIDTFVKSCNLLIDGKPPKKDQPIEFTETMVVGLRGWATVKKEQRSKLDASGREVPVPGEFRNVVKVWITNKPKLLKRVIETETQVDDPWQ